MSETLWAQTPQGRKPAGQLKKEAGRTMLVKNVSKSRHQPGHTGRNRILPATATESEQGMRERGGLD
jgi:hypothetical protein